MHFTTALGPVSTGEGDVWIAIASTPDGRLSSKSSLNRDNALAELAASLPRGQAVTCDPSLSGVAASLGWNPGALPPQLVEAVALLAVGMVHGSLLRKLSDPHVLVELLTATAGYVRAQPWERFEAAQPLELKVTGATSGTWWAMSFGGLHQECASAARPRARRRPGAVYRPPTQPEATGTGSRSPGPQIVTIDEP